MGEIFFSIFVFIFGLIVGSFLNCLIYRFEQNETKTLLKGRSFCPHCKHQLSFWDLLPVLSFFFSKGKCRYCQKSISWQYPIVEIATGLLFLLIFNFYFLIFNQFLIFNFYLIKLFLLFSIFSALLVIFVYDLKHYIIPDKVLIPFLGFVLIFKLLSFESIRALLFDFSLVLAVALFFFFIWLFSKGKAMGFGDVKLVFPLMLMLGWPLGAVGLFIAFLSGSLIGLVLMALGKKKLKSQVPFGPFLIAGAFVAFLWGNTLWQWYLHLIGL
ncbi:prepilin peptidase [Candidatus Parcubacteria bacterium]|nr:prepilin peptidase [Candidatus Parcubacteria bacterium]